MTPVPPGGPSTVNGVLYQLLWALQALGGFSARSQSIEAGELDKITLLLEPSNGGDQQLLGSAVPIVTQLKARSTGGKWSLQEIVTEVLPDLCLAVDLTNSQTEYHFVTEGTRGDWAEVDKFFKDLPPLPETENLLDELADTGELKFARRVSPNGDSTSFWDSAPYSSRRLFEKIVETVRRRQSLRGEPESVTRKKVWLLLRGFRFRGGHSHESLRVAVDRWLLERLGSADNLPEKRDHLLLELARQACQGDAKVSSTEFFAKHGLDGVPLTQWLALGERARLHLEGVLARKGIDIEDEARPTYVRRLASEWALSSPALILTGESGCGKSWLGYSLLACAAEAGHVALLVEAHGDVARTMAAAAETFWHEIAGRDEAPPLSRLRARLVQLDPSNAARPLTILVDNVQDLEEARRLVEADWEGWEVRLILSCPPTTAAAVKASLGSRGRVIDVPDFTLEELRGYLSDVLHVNWTDMPFDVSKTLRRPLLARLFRDVLSSTGWQPKNEYELYRRAWKRLKERGVTTFDLDAIESLAVRVLLGQVQYPWTVSDLRENDMDEAAVQRLVSAGWVREAADGAFEVWHDRLLNWTIAEGAAKRLRSKEGDAGLVAQAVANLFEQPFGRCGRYLAYVPMDVLWLLNHKLEGDAFRRTAAAFEAKLGWRSSRTLFVGLLPTLGAVVSPYLIERLRENAQVGSSYNARILIDGLVKCGDLQLSARGLSLLEDSDARVRRIGLQILAHEPSAQAAARLWSVHIDGIRRPAPYLWENEVPLHLHRDCMAALRACVPLAPDWLERTIQNADASSEPVHDLAYLIASLPNSESWKRCKQHIMKKVPANRERCIAACILKFRDATEQEWLESRISRNEDSVGIVAFRALASIDPQRALALFDRIDERQQYLAREWTFAELYRRLPSELMNTFAMRLREHPNPWARARVLQSREDSIDVESFDFLLDCLDHLLQDLNKERASELTADCRYAVNFINAVSHPTLLERLKNRRGSSLEESIADLLLRLGPRSGVFAEPDKTNCLKALSRISGEWFHAVLDDWLDRGGWHAQMHAAELAQRAVTLETAELLRQLTVSDEPADEGMRSAIRVQATAALAANHQWTPVIAFCMQEQAFLPSIVGDIAMEIGQPLDDETLSTAIREFRDSNGPSPGSLVAIGHSGRKDFLPGIREVTRTVEPESQTALACLLALQKLGDEEESTVDSVKRLLPHHYLPVVNALLRNGSPSAYAALLEELRTKFEPQLAAILMNHPEYTTAALDAIRQSVPTLAELRYIGGFVTFVSGLGPAALRAVASCAEIYAVAEEIAYGPDGGIHIVGERFAAIQIIAQRAPETAWRWSLSRLTDPESQRADLFARMIANLRPMDAPTALLDVLLLDPSSSVVHSIGCQLCKLEAEQVVVPWLESSNPKQRSAACRVAGFLTPSEGLLRAVERNIDDSDQEVSIAAGAALDQLRRARISSQLVDAFTSEEEPIHRWTLLESLIESAEPGEQGTPPPWLRAIRQRLTPAMARYTQMMMARRQKKQTEEFNQADRLRD